MPDIQDQRCITLAGATRALTAALQHAASIQVPVCVAVVDRGSNLVSFARMDGAPLLSAQRAWLTMNASFAAYSWVQSTEQTIGPFSAHRPGSSARAVPTPMDGLIPM